MPTKKPDPRVGAARGGRPRNAVPTAPVTGFRLPLDLVADLDRVAAELSTGGVTASRTSLCIEALRRFVAAHDASKPGARAPAPPVEPRPARGVS